MKSYLFRVIIEEDPKEDGTIAFSAYCPDLEGCTSWGYTFEETRANIREAIACHIESLLKDGEPVPDTIIELKKAPKRRLIETMEAINI
ncbi:type II toxin-antitoxin system HicB family antitoxin [bacterium]|nr:type II toxin-antitoxin system HicB family antitoxin [bacterium]